MCELCKLASRKGLIILSIPDLKLLTKACPYILPNEKILIRHLNSNRPVRVEFKN